VRKKGRAPAALASIREERARLDGAVRFLRGKLGPSFRPEAAVVLGTGLGTFESAFAPRRPPGVELRWTHAHSDWLEAAIEGGLPVLCAVAGIALLVVRHLLRAARGAVPAALAAALLALAIHAAVDFPLRIPAVAVVAAVLVGAALSVEEEPAGASLVVLARPVAVA